MRIKLDIKIKLNKMLRDEIEKKSKGIKIKKSKNKNKKNKDQI
jgi:hypothetical protein